MKARSGVAALAVAGVAAQDAPTYGAGVTASPSSSALPVSYTTLTVDDCPTTSLATLITVTAGVTVTYCPECEMGMTSPAAPKPGYTTTYTTTYLSLCPTGLVPATYTVTESCTDEKPTWTPGPSHVPQGFTVTVKDCSVCHETHSSKVTVTEPCGCEATGGTSLGPAKTPAQATPAPTPAGGSPGPGNVVSQISDGQIQAPTGSGSGSSPAPECNGSDCGGSGNQSPGGGSSAPAGNTPAAPGNSNAGSAPPYPTTTSIQCPGPECRAVATGNQPAGVAPAPSGGSPAGRDTGSSGSSPSSSAPIEPAPSGYQGAASSVHVGYLASLVVAVVVGGLAFAL